MNSDSGDDDLGFEDGDDGDWGNEYGDNYDIGAPTDTGPKLLRQNSYTLVDKDNIKKIQKDRINEIVDILGLTPDISRALLLQYNWDKDTSIVKFSEDENYIENNFKYDQTP